MGCACGPLKRDTKGGRKKTPRPVVLKALEPPLLESYGDWSARGCLPCRYGPTRTKMMACSCLSKGATAGDILPAGEICVRARRTSPRAESGMITCDVVHTR